VIPVTRAVGSPVETADMNEDRMRTQIPTEFRASQLVGKGKVRNISEGGLFVGTSEIPEEGEAVELKLSAPGRPPVEIQGLVWWTTRKIEAPNGRRGFGLRLLDASESYLQLLASLR